MRQVSQGLPSGATATTLYDTRGNMEAMVNPLGKRTTYGYDAAGRGITEMNPLGQVQTNTYDADSRLTAKTYLLMPPVTYGYDPPGLVTLTQDQLGRTTSTYDARGMVTSRLSPNGTETMTYDGTANRTLYQSTSGTRFTSVYDPNGRETTLTFGSKTHSANYDSVGQPTTETYDSGTLVKRAYDARGYMTTLVQDSFNGVVTYASTYDGAGRKTVSSRNGVLSTNTYDSDDRLTVQSRPGAVASYTYDQDTNLTSRHHQGQNIVTFTNNTFGQVTTQIQGSAVTTYTWDGAGRNTNEDDGIDAATRTWDQVGRMTAQKLGTSEVTRNFSYQHDNLRYRASEGATISTYVWDSGDLRRVIGADSNDFAVFNGQIVEGVDSEFLSDELGHITAWGSAASSQWEELEYWPYGELQTGTLPPEGLGYMGADSVMRKWIPELLYAQQRWLKPGAGRFLSVDPYWPSELAYMYVEGMPVMAVDFDGRKLDIQYDCSPDDRRRGLMESVCRSLDCCAKNAKCKKCIATHCTPKSLPNLFSCLQETYCSGKKTVNFSCDGQGCCEWLYGRKCGYTFSFGCRIHICSLTTVNCSNAFDTVLHELTHCCGTNDDGGDIDANQIAACYQLCMRTSGCIK